MPGLGGLRSSKCSSRRRSERSPALRDRFSRLRIVVCSFHRDVATKACASIKGHDAYLDNPVSAADLKAVVGRLVAGFAPQRSRPRSGGIRSQIAETARVTAGMRSTKHCHRRRSLVFIIVRLSLILSVGRRRRWAPLHSTFALEAMARNESIDSAATRRLSPPASTRRPAGVRA